VRRGVDVLPQDQPVLEREHVDSVPLDAPAVAGGGRRPLAHDESVSGVETASPEREVGGVLEDPRDVRPDLVALDALPGRVVLEDHPGSVEGDDRGHVVGVPRLVVALDRPLERRGGVPLVHVHEYRTGDVRVRQYIDVYR